LATESSKYNLLTQLGHENAVLLHVVVALFPILKHTTKFAHYSSVLSLVEQYYTLLGSTVIGQLQAF